MERDSSIRELLEDHDFDAVVVRLPENVLLLSGYWPVSGFSYVIYPRFGDPVLCCVDMEREYMKNNTIADVRVFSWGTITTPSPYKQIEELFHQVAQQYGLKEKRIAVEKQFESMAPSLNSAEPFVASNVSLNLIQRAFEVVELDDATDLLLHLRSIKTKAEIDKLKIVHEIANFGLKVFFNTLQHGKSEAEVAAAVETAIYRFGCGYKGMQHARGWAQLMTGKRSAKAYSPFPASSDKNIQKGDLALLELAVMADGYWADVTRTRAVESITEEQKKAYQSILDAHSEVKQVLRDGVSGAEIASVSNRPIIAAGFGEYIMHATGHGLGFRYHEPYPFLHTESNTFLKKGMVTSVEPGIYIPGNWGMRLEENVVITENSEPIYLSTYSTSII